MLERAYRRLEPVFVRDVIPNHKLLSTPEQWNALLEALPESAQPVQDHLREEWNGSARKKAKASTPAEKWSILQKHLSAFLKTSKPSGSAKHARTLNSKDAAKVEAFCPTLVFTYTYPRLDVNVSKMRNHLLKSPFCVHPKTGRVCVPFAAREVDAFDPFLVPTLGQLMREVDDYDRSVAASAAGAGDSDGSKEASSAVTCDWQKTSLKPYFDKFRAEFLEPLLRENRQHQSKADRYARELSAALAGDF
jgi:DNA primase small subunit